MNNNIFDIIDKYLRDQLTPKELAEFKENCQQDPAFAQEVQTNMIAWVQLRELHREKQRERWDEELRKRKEEQEDKVLMMYKKKDEELKKTKDNQSKSEPKSNRNKLLSIAAIMAFLCFGAWYVFNHSNANSRNKDIPENPFHYACECQAGAGVGSDTQIKNKNLNKLELARKELIENKNYLNGIKLYNEILKNDSLPPEDYFNLGVANLLINPKDLIKAYENLKKAENGCGNKICGSCQVNYYLGLILLNQKKRDSANLYFKKVVNVCDTISDRPIRNIVNDYVEPKLKR